MARVVPLFLFRCVSFSLLVICALFLFVEWSSLLAGRCKATAAFGVGIVDFIGGVGTNSKILWPSTLTV